MNMNLPTLARAIRQADANARTFNRPYYVYIGWCNEGYDVERDCRPETTAVYVARSDYLMALSDPRRI